MAPIIKSSKPSPLTSPAEETDRPLRSSAFAPLITKPPTPTPDTESIFDKLTATPSALPNTTKVLPATCFPAGLPLKTPTIKSSKPSPLTSPAEEAE